MDETQKLLDYIDYMYCKIVDKYDKLLIELRISVYDATKASNSLCLAVILQNTQHITPFEHLT